ASLTQPLAGHGHLACTEPALVAWGEQFGRAALPPLVVTITGDLGAGKTTLTRAICRGYGVTEDVTSPTFALVHQYAAGKSPVYHLDLYRLKSPAELTNLGWDEIPGVHVPTRLQHLPDDPTRRLLYAGGHQ